MHKGTLNRSVLILRAHLPHTTICTKPCDVMRILTRRQLRALGATACVLAAAPAYAFATSTSGPHDSLTPGGAADVAKQPDSEQPPNFRYTHLWVSKDGKTHISECEMKGFVLKSFTQGGAPQFVKQSDVTPDSISFTQLPVGTISGLHSPPGVQFVLDMLGSWYVETTDGTRRVFEPGEVMFQDNVENSPAQSQPQHGSGQAGPDPCNQMVIKVDRAPEVDHPCPF